MASDDTLDIVDTLDSSCGLNSSGFAIEDFESSSSDYSEGSEPDSDFIFIEKNVDPLATFFEVTITLAISFPDNMKRAYTEYFYNVHLFILNLTRACENSMAFIDKQYYTLEKKKKVDSFSKKQSYCIEYEVALKDLNFTSEALLSKTQDLYIDLTNIKRKMVILCSIIKQECNKPRESSELSKTLDSLAPKVEGNFMNIFKISFKLKVFGNMEKLISMVKNRKDDEFKEWLQNVFCELISELMEKYKSDWTNEIDQIKTDQKTLINHIQHRAEEDIHNSNKMRSRYALKFRVRMRKYNEIKFKLDGLENKFLEF